MDPAVAIVKSYLEPCGYFFLTKLPVRVNSGGDYRDATDLDIIAGRFPLSHRRPPARLSKSLDTFLAVDPIFGVEANAIDVIVGEVEEGHARLNRALRGAEIVAFALPMVLLLRI